jgi:hypothetical protein
VFTNTREESGVWAKMPKPSHRGSISGAACEMAEGDNGEGWCGGAYEVVVVVVGLCARRTRGKRGGLGQKPKPSRRGSISSAPCETARGDGEEGWCGGVYEAVVVVGLRTCET